MLCPTRRALPRQAVLLHGAGHACASALGSLPPALQGVIQPQCKASAITSLLTHSQAIIGGGAGGLVVLRECLKEGHEAWCFEQVRA